VIGFVYQAVLWVGNLLDLGDDGASLVEYALLVALIAVICIAAIAFLGQSASSKFSTVGSAVGS